MNGNELRNRRRRVGLTQEEMGGLLGVSRKTVCELESRDGDIDNRTALAVGALTRPPPSSSETIVAAAIRIPVADEWRNEMWRGERMYPDYLTISAPPPARHPTLMHPFFGYHPKPIGPSEQGFLTSTGRYVDRREAKQIVIASNQPRVADTPTWDSLPELYSEDLW